MVRFAVQAYAVRGHCPSAMQYVAFGRNSNAAARNQRLKFTGAVPLRKEDLPALVHDNYTVFTHLKRSSVTVWLPLRA